MTGELAVLFGTTNPGKLRELRRHIGSRLPILPVKDAKDKPVICSVEIGNDKVLFQGWQDSCPTSRTCSCCTRDQDEGWPVALPMDSNGSSITGGDFFHGHFFNSNSDILYPV